jgi:invasion protein IalB
MNSSLDRWNTFHSLVGSALFAAFALTLGTTLVVAQEGQPVPKTTVPKAAPAARAAAPAAAPARAPAAGAEGGPEESAWAKVCRKNEQTGNKQICLVQHEGLDANTGIVLATAAVRNVEGEDKQSLLVGVTTAYSLVMPAGVQIKIDDSEPIPLQYTVCLPTSCQAQMELTKEIFDKMRKGKQIIVAAMNMQQKSMGFPLPLTGFGKAFDGPPVDNAKYEEARRQMMEQSRQRQIELARRAAEQPPAGAPPQAGPQVAAQPPAETTAQKKKPAAPVTP